MDRVYCEWINDVILYHRFDEMELLRSSGSRCYDIENGVWSDSIKKRTSEDGKMLNRTLYSMFSHSIFTCATNIKQWFNLKRISCIH